LVLFLFCCARFFFFFSVARHIARRPAPRFRINLFFVFFSRTPEHKYLAHTP